MKQKNNKVLAIIACILLVVILILVAIVFKDDKKNDDSAVDKSETNVDVSTTEESVSNVSEATTSDSTTEDNSKSESAEKIPEYKIAVKVNKTNEWEAEGKYYAQFDLSINNKTSDKVTDWKVTIPVTDKTAVDNIWNANNKTESGNLVITAVDYNKEIAGKGTLKDIGFIICSKDKDELNSLSKKAVLYINGSEYKELVEETKHVDTNDASENTTENKADNIAPKKDESGTPFDNHGELSVNGTDIVDKNGNKYQLKGLSTHGIAWFPDYVNREGFKTFRDDWGANVIRLAMYTDENMGYCTDGDKGWTKDLVKSGVNYATELGMYVIVDWHILHDLDPNVHKDEAKKFFEEITSEYKDNKNIIYEICNEPNGGTTWDDVKTYANEIIPIIRKNAPNAIIIVGTPTWSQDVDIAADSPIEGYDNIMYAVHFYAATHKDNIRNKVETARQKGLPIFVSEFSICDASGNGAIDYDEAFIWFDMINKYNLSYAAWNISNKDETSSVIVSSCDKTSGWTVDDLSDAGKWIREQMRK